MDASRHECAGRAPWTQSGGESLTLDGPNPAIIGDAIRRGLVPGEEQSAGDATTHEERAILDEKELRALERAEYYAEPVAVATPEPADPVASEPTGWLARIARRFQRG